MFFFCRRNIFGKRKKKEMKREIKKGNDIHSKLRETSEEPNTNKNNMRLAIKCSIIVRPFFLLLTMAEKREKQI